MKIANSVILRLSVIGALFTGLLGSSLPSALAQKDSRGWDGKSSSMYNTPSSYGSSSTDSSFGSYNEPSHGAFTPFGRVAPSGSPGSYGSSSTDSSSNTANSGNYYDSVPGLSTGSYRPGSSANRSVPYGNPNAKYTPPPNLSFQEQQIRNKQREQQMMQQQASQPVNPSTLQAQRWQDEWRQQHPGESMPNAGQLQKMHPIEIQNSINNGFAAMKQRQAAKSREEYDLATQISKRNAAQSGVRWSKAQFERDYDQSHRDQANAYLEGIRQSREISESEEENKRLHEIYHP